MANIYKINNREDYEKYLGEHNKVCVKFSAEWCFPCKVTGENIESLADEDCNGWNFVEIDVDNTNTESICNDFNVKSLPTMVYLNNNEEVNRTVGLQTPTAIKEKINN